MRKLALALFVVVGLGLTTTSCNKEKTCVCETTYRGDDGSEYQPGDTDEVVTEDSCNDLEKTEMNTPIEGVTKETDCSEK